MLSPSAALSFLVVVDIRLVGSDLAHEGRLEVKVAGKWGTVCGNSFDDVDAGVACFMLGYRYVSECRPRLYTDVWLALTLGCGVRQQVS